MCIRYRSYCIYELWIKNWSESDLHSCEATKAVAKKAQKKFWSFKGIWTHYFLHYQCDALPSELKHEALFEAGQEWVQFIPVINFNLQLYMIITYEHHFTLSI